VRAGSWWTTWNNWLRKHSSREVDAVAVTWQHVEGGGLAAPGSYVHQG
jgi:poly(3-hydroxyalkanoate) synthetase